MTEPTRIPCNQVVSQLWEYIDGELSDERAALIRAHLDVCRRCFPEYDFHRAFVGFLGEHARQPIAPGLRQKVFEMLLREDAGGEPGDSSEAS
jgi:mycothiol system anti-sigma-R factor